MNDTKNPFPTSFPQWTPTGSVSGPTTNEDSSFPVWTHDAAGTGGCSGNQKCILGITLKNISTVLMLLGLNGFVVAGEVQHKTPEIVWGAVTNDSRAGIRIQTVFEKGGEGLFSPTVLYFGATNVSRVVEAYTPPEYERFLAVLRGTDGKEIPKTRLGKKYGTLPSKRARFDDRPTHGPKRWQILIPSTTMASQVCYFNILDHFDISKPDVYTLTVELRVYRRVGNGELQIERLPPCSVKFQTY